MMKLFLKLVKRELSLFWSNKVAFLIFVGAPLLYGLLMGSVYKQSTVRDLPIIVVDLDNTPLSNKMIDALNDNQYIEVKSVEYAPRNLTNKLMQEHYQAVVTIPDRFEADIQQKRHPEINVDINGANMLTANYASTGIQTVLSVLNAGIEIETLKKKGFPAPIAEEQFESFRITMARHYNSSSNYLVFLWPGMLGTIMQQVFLLALALSFTKEYEDGTFRQFVRYSKSTWYLLLVKSLPYWLMGIVLWVPIFTGMFPFFHVPPVQSNGALLVVTSLFIIAVTFLGIAVSLVYKTQLKATEILMIIATPSFIISGQTWPLSQMPHWLQCVSSVMPLTHYLEAVRKIMMFNANLHDVHTEIKYLSIIALTSIALAYAALRFMIMKTKARESAREM